MGELCLATYLQILYRAKCKDYSIKKTFFVGEILSILTNEFDDSSTAMSKLFTGINNPTKAIVSKVRYLTEDDYRKTTESFNKCVMPLIDTNALPEAIRFLEIAIAEDKSIRDDTVVDCVTGTRKNELTGQVEDPVAFLTGLLLFVLKSTNNPKQAGVIKAYLTDIGK